MQTRTWLTAMLLAVAAACGVSAYAIYEAQAAPIPHGMTRIVQNVTPFAIATANPPSWPYPNGVSPARIVIPAIGVDARVQHVGMVDGRPGVPSNWVDTAWYDQGTQPGGVGSAVIDGHVSSVNGPAVFYRLDELRPGDDVIVTGNNGAKLTFEVIQVAVYPRNNAPLERIFGNFNTRNLNLITCAGLWNSQARTHQDRLVVYTQLVSEQT
ncbi:MAG: class F sortase [Alicyclobacillus sp.]|nr:class F sortase [Alicyclobacillus sp.]